MLKKYLLSPLFLMLYLSFQNSYSADINYFLCGPDEDGCPRREAQYCSCIPYDTQNATKPYCFDFDARRCKPLTEMPDCPSDFIYNNQGACLAMIFQSEHYPPCPVVKQSYCIQHHSYMCEQDGHPESCRPAN